MWKARRCSEADFVVIQGRLRPPFIFGGFSFTVMFEAGEDVGATRYRTTPSSGELAVAYNFFGMRPAR